MTDLYTNIAAIQLQSHNYKSVIENCTKALNLDADNVKARYRRGMAYARSNENELAKKDLLDALRLAPTDASIRNELKSLVK